MDMDKKRQIFSWPVKEETFIIKFIEIVESEKFFERKFELFRLQNVLSI